MSDTTTTSVTIDHLLGAEFPNVVEPMTILTGQGVLGRGSVIGKITASGKGQLIAAAAVDGSEDFYAVLTEDADTTSGDVVAPVAKTGMFVEDFLTFGAATTIADVDKDAARGLGCFFKSENF